MTSSGKRRRLSWFQKTPRPCSRSLTASEGEPFRRHAENASASTASDDEAFFSRSRCRGNEGREERCSTSIRRDVLCAKSMDAWWKAWTHSIIDLLTLFEFTTPVCAMSCRSPLFTPLAHRPCLSPIWRPLATLSGSSAYVEGMLFVCARKAILEASDELGRIIDHDPFSIGSNTASIYTFKGRMSECVR